MQLLITFFLQEMSFLNLYTKFSKLKEITKLFQKKGRQLNIHKLKAFFVLKVFLVSIEF